MPKLVNKIQLLVQLVLVSLPTLQAGVSSVPVIDISPWTIAADHGEKTLSAARQRVVVEIQQACRSVGFFQILHHGVDPLVLKEAWEVTQGFFEQPREIKLQYKTINEAEYPYGFEETEQLAKGKKLDGDPSSTDVGVMDTKETFAIGPNNPASGMPPRRWKETASVPQFQSALEAYYSEMEKLADILLKIFALALGQPLDYFVDKMDHHFSALRLVHYYPLVSTEHANGPVVRAGAHTDYGALTILNSERAGLEVLVRKEDLKNEKTPEWYPMPVVPGALIINLGDLMQRWTNDEWVSTLHRVVMNTTDPGSPSEERYSMAYFVNVNGDTLVHSLTSDGTEAKYPPVTAKDHLMAKHLASMGESPENNDEL